MASVARAAAAIAAVLVREGIDYAQGKAVFKAARARAGLRAAPERRGGVGRLTLEEELRFLDQAYAQGGRTGLIPSSHTLACTVPAPSASAAGGAVPATGLAGFGARVTWPA